MEIQYLPEQIETNSDSELQLYEYFISKVSTKNKVQLSKNVFSFLLNGTKELITKTTTRIENDKFVIIKGQLFDERKHFFESKPKYVAFFSDES
jgi:hypothetical protein